MNYSKRTKLPEDKEFEFRNTFAKNLISYRREFNLRQRELAVVLNICLHNIQAYEERRSIPSVMILIGISKILNVRIEDLFTTEIEWNKQNLQNADKK